MNCPNPTDHLYVFRATSSPVAYRYAVISDIHLGHRKTPTEEIVEKLRYYVNDSLFSQIDIFVIAGDLYDQLLDLNQDETHEIDFWLFDLLYLAKKHDVLLWILEGTPLHDREQSKRILTFDEGGRFGAKVKYFDQITIHHEPSLNRNFLFVPDEMGSPPQVIAEVRKQMALHSVEQVDCAFMHGGFRYQFPDLEQVPAHAEEDYLSIVKHTISIGHVHEATVFERIYAQGSFDRLAHGTEQAKGFNVVTVYENQTHEVMFVENTSAKVYKTLTVQSGDVESSLAELDDAVKPYPEASHLRLRLPESHPLLASMDVVMRRYPGFFWISQKEKIKAKDQETTAKTRYVPIVLNEQTLAQHVLAALKERPDLEERHFKRATAFLSTLS